MSNIDLYFAIVCVVGMLGGAIFYVGRRDERVREAAERIVRESKPPHPDDPLTNIDVTFRRRRAFAFPLLLLSFVFIGLVYFDLIPIRKSGQPPTTAEVVIKLLIFSVPPLLLAVRQWFYGVTLTDSGLQIKGLKTTFVPFKEIDAVRIVSTTHSYFCRVRLKTGRELSIGPDLVGFLKFVEMLSGRLRNSKESVRNQV